MVHWKLYILHDFETELKWSSSKEYIENELPKAGVPSKKLV